MVTHQSYDETDHDWASNIEDDTIHISQAKSGANGYFCLGCTKEMQAIKGQIRKHHFRHHVKDVEHNKAECVHSSRVYREKLAFFYFMRVKEIKLPAVYKFPPKGIEGYPVLLQEAQTIVAHRVDREVTFFEDENGEIHWGKSTEIDERFLMVRPDAVFYNKDDKPILFLEFVVTHKPDVGKLNKLQRLGINTVQIIVPKLDEAAIEKEISKASKVKWTYNEIESNTEYVSTSDGNPEGIPFIDEEQRKLFEESYNCRAAQISNLIRSVKRCLGSQSYQRAKHHLEQEIQRIEDAANKLRPRLDDIQAGIEIEIHSELEPRRDKFDKSKQRFEKYYSILEARYQTRRRELSAEQELTDRQIESVREVGRTEDEIRTKYTGIERALISETAAIDREQAKVDAEQIAVAKEQRRESALSADFESAEDELRKEFDIPQQSHQQNFDRSRKDLESKIAGFKETGNKLDAAIRSRFEREYDEIVARVNERDVQGGDELSERIKSILEIRGLFGSYSDGKEALERYRKGIQLIKSGTWKEWD